MRPARTFTRLATLPTRLLGWATATAHVPLQTAVVRILVSLTWLLLLLREWPNRELNWGPDAPWSYELSREQLRADGGFSLLVLHPSGTWFAVCYLAALLVAALMLVGWHTRVVSILFMLGVVSFHNRAPFVADSGDLVLHLLSIYLVLTRCGQAFSLDARLRSRSRSGSRPTQPIWAGLGWILVGGVLLALLTGRQSEPVVPALAVAAWALVGAAWLVDRRGSTSARTTAGCLTNLVHNCGVALLMAQVVLIYSTAGWYKVQGQSWQQGSAVYYALHIDQLAPWPALSAAVASSALVVLAASYLTVMMQVAFPFAMLHPRAKKVVLVLLAGEHLGIAVVLGLPFFSAAILAADAIFLPTAWLVARQRPRRNPDSAEAERSPGSYGRAPDASVSPAPEGLCQ